MDANPARGTPTLVPSPGSAAKRDGSAMSPAEHRPVRAGSKVDDLCRACKQVRGHTVIAANADGSAARVLCDFCGSQHNFRGGDRDGTRRPGPPVGTRPGAAPGPDPFPVVSDRERSAPPMSHPDAGPDLEMLLRRIIREEAGLTPVAPADKWRGGELVLRPGRPGLQDKAWPIETFFHKVVMLRNRLRVLEQQVNGADVPDELKVKLQGYVTACYGSLTSFNVLFADDDDRFRGTGGGDR